MKINRYRKGLKRFCGVLIAFFTFHIICNVLNYIYVDESFWGRIMWHHFYEDRGRIDNIYLGSSHVYYGVNPMMLDDINGQYNFNLASSGQKLNGSYYLLKEADRNNPLSHVYLELYYMCSVKDDMNGDIDPIDSGYSDNWKNTDFMKWSRNKLEYISSIADSEKYLDAVFPFIRYRTKLNDWDYVRDIIARKDTDDYRAYKYRSESWDYLPQGRFYSVGSYPDKERMMLQSRILGENAIGEKSESYIRKIIEYCQEREIPITLFIVPVNELQLISTEHYDDYINEVRKIAKEYDVEFYDFNLAKEDYLSVKSGEYFYDSSHLNSIGADLFTSLLGKVITSDASENEKYFYDSYVEKLQAESPGIYGIYYRDAEVTVAENGTEWMRVFQVASNREEGMEYRIIMTPDEGEQYTVQEFMENKEFTVPLDEHGICTIVARMKETPDDVQTLAINY